MDTRSRLSATGLDQRTGQEEPGVQVLKEHTSPHMAVHPLQTLQAKLEARESISLAPRASITQFIPAQVSQCQAWGGGRPAPHPWGQGRRVLREAGACGVQRNG